VSSGTRSGSPNLGPHVSRRNPLHGIDFGLWTVDTLPEAAATALLAIPAGLITIGLLRAMAAGESALAAALLGGGQDETS
jgi:hypothetical protein